MSSPHPVIAALDPDRDDAGAARLGLLLGGVSHALVRQAACPVLVVPLAETATTEAPDGHLLLAKAGR